MAAIIKLTCAIKPSSSVYSYALPSTATQWDAFIDSSHWAFTTLAFLSYTKTCKNKGFKLDVTSLWFPQWTVVTIILAHQVP